MSLKTNLSKSIFFLLMLLGLFACNPKTKIEIRDDFKAYYDSAKVQGSFVLYNTKENRLIQYNPAQYQQAFTPTLTSLISQNPASKLPTKFSTN